MNNNIRGGARAGRESDETGDPYDKDPFFARLPKVAVPRGTRIARRPVNSQHSNARRSVEQADRQVAEVTAESERISAEAYEQGLAAGREVAQRELAAELQLIERKLDMFYRDSEPMVMEMALRVARRIVKINLTETVARRLVTDTIRKHAASQPYAIHVGLRARPLIVAALDELKRSHPDMRLPVVRTEQGLGEDRAILMTRFGTADLDVESQLQALSKEVLSSPSPRGTARIAKS